jgi:hypothetical protein
MPSGGATRATDRWSRTSSTRRSTRGFACSAGTSTARMWRWASARTCHICQVDRVSSIAASTRSAVCPTQSASAMRGVSAARVRAVATIEATALLPPSTAEASFIQVLRCSASDRGSCLASRVSNVACWASCSASTGVGGRPCSAWNWTASSPRRRLIWARRVDHRWFNRGSTPTISRIGRLPGSESGRAANRTPNASRRCCSREVF